MSFARVRVCVCVCACMCVCACVCEFLYSQPSRHEVHEERRDNINCTFGPFLTLGLPLRPNLNLDWPRSHFTAFCKRVCGGGGVCAALYSIRV